MNKTYSDILILLKAGYTKEEIDNMADAPVSPPFQEQAAVPALAVSPSSPSESLPEESVPAPPVDDRPTQPASDPAPQPAADPVGDQIRQLQEMMSGLIAQIQQGSREQAEMGARIIDPHTSAIQTLRSISNIPTPPNS